MTLRAGGVPLDESLVGTLREYRGALDDAAALGRRLREDGYLLFRGLIEKRVVEEARRELLLKYAIAGEIDERAHPLMDAAHSKHSLLDRVNLLALTESLRSGMAYNAVVQHPVLVGVVERLSGRRPMRSFDFKWIRMLRPGEGTSIHCDAPYVNRGTPNVYSVWIPLGQVRRSGGAVFLLERSHELACVRRYCRSREPSRPEWLNEDAATIARTFGRRWLTADFEAGDAICFSPLLVHGGLDNGSPDRCRLSTDLRYYPASEEPDPRWNAVDVSRSGTRAFFPGRVDEYPGEGFEWKHVDRYGRLVK